MAITSMHVLCNFCSSLGQHGAVSATNWCLASQQHLASSVRGLKPWALGPRAITAALLDPVEPGMGRTPD
eukprot:14232907-Alexandrium_andersonii.AAC.1